MLAQYVKVQFSSVQFQTLWFETLTAVCLGDIPPEQSLKMTGLVLASYRTDSIPCSQTTCVVTAAHACTSPQPTMSSGPWVLESVWDHSQTSTAYPWLREPRPRACEHSTRWEDGKTELTISSMRWQGGTWKSII